MPTGRPSRRPGATASRRSLPHETRVAILTHPVDELPRGRVEAPGGARRVATPPRRRTLHGGDGADDERTGTRGAGGPPGGSPGGGRGDPHPARFPHGEPLAGRGAATTLRRAVPFRPDRLLRDGHPRADPRSQPRSPRATEPRREVRR